VAFSGISAIWKDVSVNDLARRRLISPSPRLPTSDCDNTSRPPPTTHRMGETRPASRRARFEGRAPFYGLQARMQGRRIHPPPQHTGTIIVYIILP
jgi:hypothetical protein